MNGFTDDVGGVGANLRIIEDGRVLSYASEFVERSREVILRAMNHNGHVMILDGGAAIYRTEIVLCHPQLFLDLPQLLLRHP